MSSIIIQGSDQRIAEAKHLFSTMLSKFSNDEDMQKKPWTYSVMMATQGLRMNGFTREEILRALE